MKLKRRSHAAARNRDRAKPMHAVRVVLSRILSEVGYTVRECATGGEALDAMPDFKPDLVILDFAMPGLNGAEVENV